MENEEDISCIIIDDDASEDLIREPVKGFDSNLEGNVLSSPNGIDERGYGGYENPCDSFNYFDYQNYMDFNPPDSDTPAVGGPEELEEAPNPSIPVLNTPSPKKLAVCHRAAGVADTSIVDLTTPTKETKPAGGDNSNSEQEGVKALSKRKKSRLVPERPISPLERSSEFNLSLNDSELVDFLARPSKVTEIIPLIDSRSSISVEDLSYPPEPCDPPPPKKPKSLPKALSLDTLLSEWNTDLEEGDDPQEQIEEPILTPKSQSRLDKKKRREEIQLEKTAHRQKERQIATINKQTVDTTQAWQDVTLLVDSQWAADKKVGQELIALCENDGAKVVEDSRMTLPFSMCWELKTDKRYDEARSMFVPLPRPIHLPVRKILLKWDAPELLEWCLAKKGLVSEDAVDAARFDMQIVKLSYPSHQVIAVVAGTQSLFRSIRSQVNRSFHSQVRALDGEAVPANRTPREGTRGRHELSHIELFEDFLIQLHVLHDVHVVQLEAPSDIVEFLHATTKEVCAIPHRPQETLQFLNLPELSTRKSDSVDETWRLILEQIYLVTPTIASAVAKAYPSFGALSSALRSCSTEQQKLALLSEIQVTPPTGRSRRLGGSLASRILKAFTSTDPNLPIS